MSEETRFAILGWGSLIWDHRPEFDRWHDDWRPDGPGLPIEFSRLSSSRDGALTLVIDEEHGSWVQVAWCLSKRVKVADAASDLRCREGTTNSNIGQLIVAPRKEEDDPESIEGRIAEWARDNDIQAVVWTQLRSNFSERTERPFSVANAIVHLQGLPSAAKAGAAEYVWRAPSFVQTPLRTAIEVEPWFHQD